MFTCGQFRTASCEGIKFTTIVYWVEGERKTKIRMGRFSCSGRILDKLLLFCYRYYNHYRCCCCCFEGGVDGPGDDDDDDDDKDGDGG